jgi:hypothetical integral membrane protein (TIGR02206 family)
MNLPAELFAPYSALHALTLAVCALLIVAPAGLARALPPGAEPALRRALALTAAFYWLAYNIAWNWHGLDLRTGLPLQICDLNGLIAPLALLTGRRWLRATLYFWTSVLTLQAFIQPTLIAGPALLGFWAFWFAHTVVAACAVYDLAVLGFRPRWGDFARAALASAAYLAVVVPINLRVDSNYGFIGNPPAGVKIPPFVEALGPWPQRALIVVALGALGFLVALLPWQLVARAFPSPSPLVGEGGRPKAGRLGGGVKTARTNPPSTKWASRSRTR